MRSSVIETLDVVVTSLAKTVTTLTVNVTANEYTISLENNKYCSHKQGLRGFNPDATIVGIESALANWNWDKSMILWNALLSAPLKIICGETQSATNRQKLGEAQKKIEYTKVGELCRNQAWLPDKSGNWRKPSELQLADLPNGFEPTSIAAKELSVKLGMKQPEREQALEFVTGGDPKLKRIIEHYQSGSDSEREKMLKMIPHEIPPEPAPSFKDGLKNLGRRQRGAIEPRNHENSPVLNPDRYQEKLTEGVEDAVEDHLSTPRRISFSPVKDHPSNEDARRFLYEEYSGRCQVTGTTFPKASKNANGTAENYFEACSLLSYTNANYLNDAGNMLCVSADTRAKLKLAACFELDRLEDTIELFKANNQQTENVTVRISLAGEKCAITWSQRHFMRLVALYEKA